MTTLLWLSDAATLADEALAPFVHWLSCGEGERYRGFTRPLRRRQFLVGRVMLRQALGMLLGVPARRVSLLERPGAAPQLAWPQAEGIGYSISHSGNWVACAASLDAALGLDIETIDPARDLLGLAEQAFDPDEQAGLRALPAADRARAFYALWCAREARFKLGRDAGDCIHLAHGGLAVALCSSRRLTPPPRLIPHAIYQ